jgi:hypothetical protein
MVVSDKTPPPTEGPFEWLIRIIAENRSITYPILCGIIDGFANSLKQDVAKWFDEQGNLINRNLTDRTSSNP